jgi:8-oxo-dGTP pyrophosphatase MutT (NUDIX family)
VSGPSPERAALRACLYALDAAPVGPGWNREQLVGLVPNLDTPREAAVLLGLIERDRVWQVLLTERGAGLRQHPGQVGLPGGGREAGDADAVATALREAAEEIGLRPDDAEPLGYLDPLLTISGYRVLPVVAELRPAARFHACPGEVERIFEVPLALLLTPDNLRQVPYEIAGRVREVPEFADGGAPGRRIWGTTAAILGNLRQRLAGRLRE